MTDVWAKTHEPRLGYGPTSGSMVGNWIEYRREERKCEKNEGNIIVSSKSKIWVPKY